jgi:signal transduction histidine kinase
MNPFNPLFDMPVTCDFTATLAHEIRNPLATIDLSLALMLAERQDDELKKYADIIKRSSERINELVIEMVKNRKMDETRWQTNLFTTCWMKLLKWPKTGFC